MNVYRIGAALILGVLVGGCSSSDGDAAPEEDAGDDTNLPDTKTSDTSTGKDTATDGGTDTTATDTTTTDTATADSTASDSTATDSTATDSTATDSTATDSVTTDSSADVPADIATDAADVASDVPSDTAASSAPLPLLARSPFPFDGLMQLGTDALGNVVLGGTTTDPWTAPGGTTALTYVGAKDAWLAKYDDAGTHIWSKEFGSTVDDGLRDLSVVQGAGAQAGNVAAIAAFGGSVDLGGGSVTGPVLFVRSAAAGAHVWSKQITATAPPTLFPWRIAADPSGNVYVTFVGKGTQDFGAPVGSITTSGNDVVVAKYSSAGALVWLKKFGDAGDSAGNGIATDASGNVFITGSNKGGTLDLGGGKSTTAGVFVLKLDTDGAPVWIKGAGPSSDNGGLDVVVDPTGDVMAVGGFSGGSIDWGGGTLTGSGAFVAKFKAADGAHVWSKLAPAIAPRLGVDSLGNLLIAGRIGGAGVDFGGGVFPTPASGDSDMYIVKLAAATGAHVWSRSISSPTNKVEWGYGIAGGLLNAVWACGRGGQFGTTNIDLGGTLKAQGPAFLVKYPAL